MDPIGLSVNNYSNCKQDFKVTDSPGVDRVWLSASTTFPLENRGSFFATMQRKGTPAGVFTPTYSNYPIGQTNRDGADPFLFFRGCPNQGDTACTGTTFPMLFPSVHLPVDATGQVQGLGLEFLLET